MLSPQKTRRVVAALSATFLLGMSSSALAQQSTKTAPPVASKETRDKMAQAHEQMATCLRSDRALAECRQEMMKTCQSLGAGACEMGAMNRGAMRHRSTNAPSTTKP